jgi:diaminopropionate ammonia-lyase
MSTYRVQHLNSGQTFDRPAIFANPFYNSDPRRWRAYAVDPAIEAFHRALPDHAETTLHELPSLAAELGVAHIFVKDESKRFGLPAFKILGASWAVHRAMCEALDLPLGASFDRVRQALSARDATAPAVKIAACTEGNWGRALARMSKYLGISATIYVPGLMSEYTRSLLRSESAEVVVLENGTYDNCIAAAREDAERTGASLIMDTSWEGYERIPQVRLIRYASRASSNNHDSSGSSMDTLPC